MARDAKIADEPARPPEAEAIESDMQGDETEVRGSQPAEDDSIARRAYERFRMRGGEHGRDQEDWFEAERELSRKTRD